MYVADLHVFIVITLVIVRAGFRLDKVFFLVIIEASGVVVLSVVVSEGLEFLIDAKTREYWAFAHYD